MIQIILFAVIAFVIGLGGGTGLRIMTAPKVTPGALHGADSLAVAHHADSTHIADSLSRATMAHGAPKDSAHVPGTPADALHAAAAASAASTTPPAEQVTEPQQFKQVGSILLAMKPDESGRILAYLTDDHVEGILRSMGPRQAATILAEIPSPRAATLSRRLLVPAGEAERR